jgi:two-component system cell cycle response regulator
METLILVVGSDEFLATLPEQIRDGIFTVEVAANSDEARSWIEVRPPDVLMVQASLDGSLELCRWLKQQTQLTWIYCILLEDRPQIIPERSPASWNWEFEITAAALEESADAYVWLLQGEATDENQLTPSHRLLLAQIQVGFRKVKKYRELMQTNYVLSTLALVDPLTKLNNRRALEWYLPRQIRSSRTQETPLSLIVLDVDYFKVINDTYGHLVGDCILQLLCARLRHNLRFQDTAFRYGGEEFVIIMRNTDCQEALGVARRLGRLVSDQPFSIDNTLTINVTISLGVDSLRQSDDAEGVNLLARADQYLLQSKAAGRNRIMGCEDHSWHASAAESVSP